MIVKEKLLQSQESLVTIPNYEITFPISPFLPSITSVGGALVGEGKVNMEGEERKGNYNNNTKDACESHKESFYIYLNLRITHRSLCTHTV